MVTYFRFLDSNPEEGGVSLRATDELQARPTRGYLEPQGELAIS